MKKILNISFYLLIGIALYQTFLAGNSSANAQQSYELMTKGSAIIIDVREESEIQDGMIKGAKWFPLSKIEGNKEKIMEDIKKIAEGKKVFVYCRSGYRSGKVQTYLKDYGVKAMNLGGYGSLVSQGLPTQKGRTH